MSLLEHSPVFNRNIRKGSWSEQLTPTYKLIATAIEEGRRRDAIELIDYFDVEAAVCYNLYVQWGADGERFLAAKGLSEPDLEAVKDELRHLVNRQWAPGVRYDRDAELHRYRMMKAQLVRELNAPPVVALKTLATWKELWRSIHDREVDYVSGIFNTAHIRYGEASIEELYRDYVIGDLFAFRYERFDVSKNSWAESFDALIYVSIEAMRGHLVGPERDGTMEMVEHPDRVELSFMPCGSGGRTIDGDRVSGTPSRHEAPFYYNTMQEKHDFSWNETGVCHYCVHCAVLMEKLPIERFGYPVRVVEPPTYPDNTTRCRWTMYRDPRDVPASAYARMGEVKPAPDQPLGSASRPVGAISVSKRSDVTLL
jgi:hypothetical protein